MLKASAFLTCLLFIGLTETSKAEPPDAPDVVRIDGQPCNRACQSYMAWSRSLSGRSVPDAPQRAAPQQPPAEVQKTAGNTSKKATPDRIARQSTPKNDAKRPVPNGQLARAERAGAKPVAPHTTAAPPTEAEAEKAFERAKTIPPVQDLTGTIPDSKPAAVPDSPSTTATAPGPVAPVPATKVQTTAVPPSEAPPNPATSQQPLEEKPEKAAAADTNPSEIGKAPSPDSTKTVATASPAAEPLVAVLLVRTEIKSVSDLANKVVAIDASDAVSRTKTAIVSAGGADVQLSEGDRMALLRVMDGEVQAAVVTLESPQKAATWTEVPGFNVLRLPLAPAPEKEGPG